MPAQSARLSQCLERLSEVETALAFIRRSLKDAVAEDAAAEQAFLGPREVESSAWSSETMPERATEPIIMDHVVMDTMLAEANGVSVVAQKSLSEGTGAAMLERQNAKDIAQAVWREAFCFGLCSIPIIHPEHINLILWNLIGLFFIMYLAFAIPLQLAFGIEPEGFWWYVAVVIDVYFIMDFLLNFCTAYRDADNNNELVTEFSRIARQYVVSGWAFLDFVASVPWDLLPDSGGGYARTSGQLFKGIRFVRAFRVLRVTKLVQLAQTSKLKDKFDVVIESRPAFVFGMGLIRVTFLLFVITHWAACMWFAVGSTGPEGQTWVDAHLSECMDVHCLYIYSFYFTLTTMTTVGYGDIVAQNFTEVCFVLFLLLLAAIVFAGLLGALTDLISNLNTEKQAYADKRRALSQYMQWRGVPQGLFLAIRKHICYLWETTEGYSAVEDEVKEKLSPALKKELCYHIYGQYLHAAPFLAWMWNYTACLKELSEMLRSVFFTTGDYIFHTEVPNEQIHMLISGAVRVSLNESVYTNVGETHDSGYAHVIESAKLLDIIQRKRPMSRNLQRLLEITDSEEGSGKYIGDSKIFRQATIKLRLEEERLTSAAQRIQSGWRRRRRRSLEALPWWMRTHVNQRQKKPSGRIQLARTRVVQAPNYFGEACLWVPFKHWSNGKTQTYGYSARCETQTELVLIPRSAIQTIIERFSPAHSPWLRDRFETFRTAVVEGQAGIYEDLSQPWQAAPAGASSSATNNVAAASTASVPQPMAPQPTPGARQTLGQVARPKGPAPVPEEKVLPMGGLQTPRPAVGQPYYLPVTPMPPAGGAQLPRSATVAPAYYVQVPTKFGGAGVASSSATAVRAAVAPQRAPQAELPRGGAPASWGGTSSLTQPLLQQGKYTAASGSGS